MVVTVLSAGQGLAGDAWVFDLEQGTLSRVTFDGDYQFPEWSPDGRRILLTRLTTGIYEVPAGGGAVERLMDNPRAFEALPTHDGRTIVYRHGSVPGDVYYVHRDSLDQPRPFLDSRFDERASAISPDDRWLAYVSNETGREEIYVRPFPDARGKWQVSVAGGSEPRWRRDGRELFYRNGDTLFAIPVRPGAEFAVGQRVALFTGAYGSNSRHASYDVHPDGRRFIFVTGEAPTSADVILVQNLLAAVPRTAR